MSREIERLQHGLHARHDQKNQLKYIILFLFSSRKNLFFISNHVRNLFLLIFNVHEGNAFYKIYCNLLKNFKPSGTKTFIKIPIHIFYNVKNIPSITSTHRFISFINPQLNVRRRTRLQLINAFIISNYQLLILYNTIGPVSDRILVEAPCYSHVNKIFNSIMRNVKNITNKIYDVL